MLCTAFFKNSESNEVGQFCSQPEKVEISEVCFELRPLSSNLQRQFGLDEGLVAPKFVKRHRKPQQGKVEENKRVNNCDNFIDDINKHPNCVQEALLAARVFVGKQDCLVPGLRFPPNSDFPSTFSHS